MHCKDTRPHEGIGEKIKALRLSKQMSQGTLAKMVEVSGTRIHNWEIERYYPSMIHIGRLCKALDVPVEFFL